MLLIRFSFGAFLCVVVLVAPVALAFREGHGLGVFGATNKIRLAYGVGFLSNPVSRRVGIEWADFDFYSGLFELCVEFY